MGVQEAIGASIVALMTVLVMMVQSHAKRRKADSERPPAGEGKDGLVVYISALELRGIIRQVVRDELRIVGYRGPMGSYHGD